MRTWVEIAWCRETKFLLRPSPFDVSHCLHKIEVHKIYYGSRYFEDSGRLVGRYYRPLVDNRPFCLNGRYYIEMVDISSKSLIFHQNPSYFIKIPHISSKSLIFHKRPHFLKICLSQDLKVKSVNTRFIRNFCGRYLVDIVLCGRYFK